MNAVAASPELYALCRFLVPRISARFRTVTLMPLCPPSESSPRSDRPPALASCSPPAVFHRSRVSGPARVRCRSCDRPVLHTVLRPAAGCCSPRLAASPVLTGAACSALLFLFSRRSLPLMRSVGAAVASFPRSAAPAAHARNTPCSLPPSPSKRLRVSGSVSDSVV